MRLGRPQLLRQAQLNSLRNYLASQPSAYLKEMQDFFYKHYDIEVSLSTVWRALERLNFSRKLTTKRAQE